MTYPWTNPAIWHAINVHLPIVLVMLGLPLVCLLAITRGKSRGLRWGVVGFYLFAAFAAWFAAQTGERAMDALPTTASKEAWDRINFHEWMAEKVWLLAIATAGMLLLANFPRRWARQTFTTLALVFSVVTVVWVTVTAHSGGVAVYEHGMGTVAMHMQPGNSAVATTQTTQPVAAAVAGGASAPVANAVAAGTQAVSYKNQIKPLLLNKCAECHAGSETKGGFDASTVAAIIKGGKKAGAGLIAGKPEESSIVQYIDGRKQPRMPKGGKEMSPAEIALIKAWIAAGAIDDTNSAVAVGATPPPAGTPNSAIVAPAVAAAAVAAAPNTTSSAAPAPVVAAPKVEEPVSPDWDPQVKFNPAESNAVRRFVRMQKLPPAPQPPKVDVPTFNPIDNFIAAKWPATQPTVVTQVASAGDVAPAIVPPTAAKPAAEAISPGTPVPAPAAPAPTTKPVDPALCDDSTYIRRVYLDLIGMVPTAEEARKFVADPAPDKRIKLVDALLSRSKDYAGNWVPWWEDALTSNGLFQGGVGTHGNYRTWILNNFEANKPFDTMVQELLDPSMPNNPGKYILNDNHLRTVQSSSDVAQVFLGTAIKCASCHSHFLNDEWPQARAVAFAGFFTDKDIELIRCERKSGQFIQTHFMFDLPAAPTTVPADPAVRLKRVAQLITDPTNPRFAKTIVNRLWKRYMGLGLFEPVDDYREDTPPSHPELLTWLADDFIRNGYDVKHTVRLIVTSRTYQLRYDPTVEDHFDVAKPKDPRYFRSPGLRRLTMEQLLDSAAITMNQRPPEKRMFQVDESTTLTRSLGKPPTRNEVSTQRPEDTAVVQALEMMNGPEYSDRIYKGDLVQAGSVQSKLEQLVDDVYWSAFSRPPSAKEKEAGLAFLKAAPVPATTQPVEVVWLEDALPPGAAPQGTWKFAGPPDQPIFSGKLSHTEAAIAPGITQHLFLGATFPVMPADVLFTYVWIDAANPPKEIMLQFMYAGDWRRAVWGEDQIPFKPKTLLGPLPKAGEWVRLEIPAAKIGIDKPGTISGIAYTQFGGRVIWDKSGASKGPPVTDPQVIGDMLWALITSPEFQYVK